MEWAGGAAVRTQEIFDRAHTAENEALGQPRMRIHDFNVTLDFRVTKMTRKAGEIEVSPLSVGFRIARRDTREADLRLSVTVEQVELNGWRESQPRGEHDGRKQTGSGSATGSKHIGVTGARNCGGPEAIR
jgi:hypothetical protein